MNRNRSVSSAGLLNQNQSAWGNSFVPAYFTIWILIKKVTANSFKENFRKPKQIQFF